MLLGGSNYVRCILYTVDIVFQVLCMRDDRLNKDNYSSPRCKVFVLQVLIFQSVFYKFAFYKSAFYM